MNARFGSDWPVDKTGTTGTGTNGDGFVRQTSVRPICKAPAYGVIHRQISNRMCARSERASGTSPSPSPNVPIVPKILRTPVPIRTMTDRHHEPTRPTPATTEENRAMTDRPDPPANRCRTCDDFRQRTPGDGPGECMYRPPIVTEVAFANRPRTMPDDWCRSWSPNSAMRLRDEMRVAAIAHRVYGGGDAE